MKSLRILAPYALLILCGLVNWSHSHPTPGISDLEEDVANSLGGNMRSDKNLSGVAKAALADDKPTLSHTPDPSSKMLQGVTLDTEKNKPSAKPSKDSKSFSGSDAEANQTNKATQPKKLTQEEKKKLILEKLRMIFLTWPAKVWKYIKQWIAKTNFFKPKAKKPIISLKDKFKIPWPKPKTSSGPNLSPAEETPDKLSVRASQDKPTHSKDEEFQEDTRGDQSFSHSSQLNNIRYTPDGIPYLCTSTDPKVCDRPYKLIIWSARYPNGSYKGLQTQKIDCVHKACDGTHQIPAKGYLKDPKPKTSSRPNLSPDEEALIKSSIQTPERKPTHSMDEDVQQDIPGAQSVPHSSQLNNHRNTPDGTPDNTPVGSPRH
ncbi:uncharacterized protein MELLADRAFT_85344 [Melampsora larici-populina 98AG31]|uniref:Secreted protein n=1 Tax=Melampsora larici-populina (strain 98AG31 / pathotype 3-4-7) TaxID=747676 RepID=F4SD24_MELLP|nr:uncharacterized protein MELLADRAFT_85344 [Melampsora larici-populina 98AG31]EGF97453.1 secreted protein [Melampsora larici-populina 98AG31]